MRARAVPAAATIVTARAATPLLLLPVAGELSCLAGDVEVTVDVVVPSVVVEGASVVVVASVVVGVGVVVVVTVVVVGGAEGDEFADDAEDVAAAFLGRDEHLDFVFRFVVF